MSWLGKISLRRFLFALLFAAAAALAARLWTRGSLKAPEAGLIGAAAVLAVLLARNDLSPLAVLGRMADDLAQGRNKSRIFETLPGEYGRLAQSLNRLAERIENDFSRLRRLDEMRRDFVANVSHELRTPLAAIKAFSETLSSGALAERETAEEFIREIEKSADRMSRLVDDLLELSALESGQRPGARENVSLMRAAAEVVAALMPLAQKKQIVLRLDPFPDMPDVQADKGQMKQVFTNLIDNAIKFTGGKGLVQVRAELRNGRETVFIQDSGCGIPAEDLPRIFERFYRVDKARSREMGGTGLGLAIVKHIVEGHGGSVSVESRFGEGTTFRVEFPAPLA
ncbi:MAG: HAMP domain-containing protein [Elusimicrobia bacterium]|nr:HAMP domain-containing protein [Elusimicrobiota bacterium]